MCPVFALKYAHPTRRTQESTNMNLLLVVLAGLIAANGEWVLATQPRETRSAAVRLGAGLALYAVAMFLFALSLRCGEPLANGAMFVIAYALAVAVGRVALRETVSAARCVGVALAIGALVLLQL
jgi:drug/metabolite transporter (DMT)-like permease